MRRRSGGPQVRSQAGGFTLLEVVVALLVLELSISAAAGLLVLASATLTRAERLDRAAILAAAVLDSVAQTSGPAEGREDRPWGAVAWRLEATGEVDVWALGHTGDTLLSVGSVAPLPGDLP